jgi:hypothetical protein
VNFLLHHHLAGRDLGDAAAAAGATLPDVWRMADRRARANAPRTEGAAPSATSEAGTPLAAVTAGVAHHMAVDVWFHRSPSFERGETATREVLRRARSAPKMGLFAHVAWELCLDGALLRRAGTDTVLAALRASFAAVRPALHHRVADAWVKLPADDRPRFEARVDRILDALAAGPWVSGYATAAGVVERLEGVRARLGFVAMPAEDRAEAIAGLEALHGEADAALDGILLRRSS